MLSSPIWGCDGQLIAGTMVTRIALLLDQSLEMRGILDLLSLAVAPLMAGQHLLPVDDADTVGLGQHRQLSPHMGVGRPARQSHLRRPRRHGHPRWLGVNGGEATLQAMDVGAEGRRIHHGLLLCLFCRLPLTVL